MIATDSAGRLAYMNTVAEADDRLGVGRTPSASPLTAGLSHHPRRYRHAAIENPFETVRRTGEKISLCESCLVDQQAAAAAFPMSAALRPVRDGARPRSQAPSSSFATSRSRRAAERALQSSEESRAENAEALFEEKERAQVTLNSIGDAVVSTIFWGRVTYLNVVAERMTGWSQAEASGRALDDVFRLVDVNDPRTDSESHGASHYRR